MNVEHPPESTIILFMIAGMVLMVLAGTVIVAIGVGICAVFQWCQEVIINPVAEKDPKNWDNDEL